MLYWLEKFPVILTQQTLNDISRTTDKQIITYVYDKTLYIGS